MTHTLPSGTDTFGPETGRNPLVHKEILEKFSVVPRAVDEAELEIHSSTG
jgi:hypothetical protein